MACSFSEALLYGIVDLGYCPEENLPAAARALISGGAGIIQLRAKGCHAEKILEWAHELALICKAAGVPFIVNDFIEIAQAVDADGVHLGQDDGPLSAAREALATGKIVGRSTHSPEQARAALAEGADYIGFGPLFPTPTKVGRPSIGIQHVAAVQREVGSQIPVFCIGGIKRDNLSEVQTAGAKRVVIVSDLLQAPHIAAATREVVARLRA